MSLRRRTLRPRTQTRCPGYETNYRDGWVVPVQGSAEHIPYRHIQTLLNLHLLKRMWTNHKGAVSKKLLESSRVLNTSEYLGSM